MQPQVGCPLKLQILTEQFLGRIMKDVPEIEIASKENRMVDWHASMDKTKHV